MTDTTQKAGFMIDAITGTGYRSYLIRFWQSTEQGGWRASAQCVQSGNTVLFGNVESLLTFLQTETIGKPPAHEAVVRTEVGD